MPVADTEIKIVEGAFIVTGMLQNNEVGLAKSVVSHWEPKAVQGLP